MDQFGRTQLLLGKDAMEKIASSHVAVFGLGGVGGYVCEALVRSGVGTFTLVDSDRVDISNLNRQIIATLDTVGLYKTEVMKQRMQRINPEVTVNMRNCFFLPENADEFDFSEYDYVVDAIDTVTAKIELILRCRAAGVPIISSMGTGNKLDPGRLKVADIYKTQICPLARVMRRELKKRGVERLTVVYSDEPPIRPLHPEKDESGAGGMSPGTADGADPEKDAPGSRRRSIPGSTAFVPATAGLMIASRIIRDLVGR